MSTDNLVRERIELSEIRSDGPNKGETVKVYRVHISVPGLPEYETIVVARSHKKAEALVPNPLGGKVRTVLLKGAKAIPLATV